MYYLSVWQSCFIICFEVRKLRCIICLSCYMFKLMNIRVLRLIHFYNQFEDLSLPFCKLEEIVTNDDWTEWDPLLILTNFSFFHYRKNDLRELKVLQKQENKQHQDLMYKSHCDREEQERKFDMDMQVIKYKASWEGWLARIKKNSNILCCCQTFLGMMKLVSRKQALISHVSRIHDNFACRIHIMPWWGEVIFFADTGEELWSRYGNS